MIYVELTQEKFWQNSVEGYIFFMTEEMESASDLVTLNKIDKEFYPQIKEILKKTDQDNLGKLMGQIMKDLQGQADGNQVKKILEEEIAHKK